jgi:hypothetical protein
MSKLVLHDAQILVGGTDLSSHCDQVTIEDDAEDVEITTFGLSASVEAVQGFKDVSITATFFQDYAILQAHQTLQPLYDAGSAFVVQIVPDGRVPVSDSNPRFVLTSHLLDYDPLDGVINDAVDLEVEFVNASPSGLTVDTGAVAEMFVTTGGLPDPDDYPAGSEWIEVV